MVEDDTVIGVAAGGRGGREGETVRPRAEDGGGETDAVEDGRFLGSVGRGIGSGIGRGVFTAEVLNVFEGGTREVTMTRLDRRLDSGRRSQPLRQHEREMERRRRRRKAESVLRVKAFSKEDRVLIFKDKLLLKSQSPKI